MKTIVDLNTLIPQLSKLILENPEIGKTNDGDVISGWEYNYVSFKKEGWLIEVEYKCTGLWNYIRGDYYTPDEETCVSAWCEVIDITATHTDTETGEETVFEVSDLKDLYNTLNLKLSSF